MVAPNNFMFATTITDYGQVTLTGLNNLHGHKDEFFRDLMTFTVI